MPKKIVVDPFFDGADTRATEGAAEYAPLESTELARSLPAGPGGLRGTVIPKAATGDGGAPIGWKPAELVRTEIHVDPDIAGQSTVVQVADLQSDKVAEAMKSTAGEDPRIRVSAVYNAIANSREADEQVVPVVSAQNAAAPEAVSPLQAFNSAIPITATTEPAYAPITQKPTAPTTWVTFEIEGFGEHQAPYHRVIRSDSNLVLVYDTKYAGTQRFFPRTTDQPLGIHVKGESVAYFAHTTGIEFSDDGVDYCVLLIEHEAPLPTE